MIQLFFRFGGEKVLVKIENHNVTFGNTSFGCQMATIDGLKLDYQGVCREFPELETSDRWREEAINRFKDNINNMKTEEEIGKYLMEDLQKFGYVLELKQKKGHRPRPIK